LATDVESGPPRVTVHGRPMRAAAYGPDNPRRINGGDIGRLKQALARSNGLYRRDSPEAYG